MIGYRGNKRHRAGRRGLVGMLESLEIRSLLSATTMPESPVQQIAEPEVVPNELLIQFRAGSTGAAMAAAHAGVNLRVEETIHTSVMQASGLGPMQRVTLGNGVAMKQAIDALSRNPLVSYVEPNYVYRPAVTPNDTYYTNGGLWGMYGSDSPVASGPAGTTNAWGSNAEQAWNNNITGSRSIVVGIIDEGVQTTHPDLNDNIWVNPYEVAGDGIDNDGNGYVDDIHGWDFFHNDNTVYDAGEDAHGTHVAGTIGGEGNNSSGVVGVNWAVTMISTKFLGPTGGSTSNAVKALDYLTDLKNRHGINIVATNNSWGGGGYSQSLHDAIIRSAKKDILFVAAAGNSTSNNDTTASYPSNYNTLVGTSTQTAAAYDAVIAVASITNTGAISSFSSYGATTVDIGAPGSSITSSVPVNTYATYNGTSMATPHVTGAVALYASAQGSTISAASIRNAILTSAVPTTSLTGKTTTGGRLNVYEAIRKLSFVDLDKAVYGSSQVAGISLTSSAANLNSGVADTVVVSVRSTSETTPISVTLTETGINTGLFTGTLQLGSGTPVADSTLQVAHNDTITVQYAALNLSDTATVDAQAPSISAINASPGATTATVTWTTGEASIARVRYGLSPSTLTQTWNGSQYVTSHSAVLNGLAAATTWYYQIEVTDAVGNTGSSSVLSFTTQNPAAILYVDDDQGATFERFFTAAFAANSLAYDTWNVSAAGVLPTGQDLQRYRIVVWNTGSDYNSVNAGLSVAEQSAITQYLTTGGRIFISGQDVLYNGVSVDFQTNYLKIASFTNDVATAAHTESGVAESLITNGMSLPVTAPADFGSLYVDSVAPAAGAVGLLQHGVTTAAAPFSGISYRGDYANGGFGIVFSTLPFESLSSTAAAPNNQATFLRKTFEFLSGEATIGINVSSPAPSAITTEGGSQVSFTVVLASQPSADVTIPVQSSDVTEGTVAVTSLTFTPVNWSTPQTITVTGVNDAVDDGNIGYSILLGAASSADASYNGLNPADVSLSNTDDDTAGITVSSLSGSSTTESGGVVTFTVRLNSEPVANVTVPVSSSDTTEGVVSAASLVFTSANWNVAQTVTVTGVDDTIFDGSVAYTIVLAAATSTDALYNGINPADAALTNIDNEAAPATKFYVVDDATVNRTFEYDVNGTPIENYPTNSGNAAPRGVATVVAGDKLWVVDANRNVYIYNNSGALLGSWLAGSMANNATVEGVATDGTNIWIIDARSDRVFYYANAASRLSGTQAATTSFLLASGNVAPKDIVFGTEGGVNYLWTVNATASLDRVFRYTLNASGVATAVTSWTLNTQNANPTGITLDPSNASMDIWISDNGTDRVYRYANARTLTTPVLTSSFALAATNLNPQGIADPPTADSEPALSGYRLESTSPATIPQGPQRKSSGNTLWTVGSGSGQELKATEGAWKSSLPVVRAGKSAGSLAYRSGSASYGPVRSNRSSAERSLQSVAPVDTATLDGLFSELGGSQNFLLDRRD